MPPTRPPRGAELTYAALAKGVLDTLDARLAEFLQTHVGRSDAAADGDGGGGSPMVPPRAVRGIVSALRYLLTRITSPDALKAPLEAIAGRVVDWTGSEVMRQVEAATGRDLDALGIDLTADNPTLAAQVTAFRRANTSLIRTMGQRRIARVRRVLTEKGAGTRVEDIAARIRDETGTTTSHARLLARDQVLKLNAEVTETRHAEAGITEYIWRTSKDERVREEHKALEGKRFRYDDPPVQDRYGNRANPGVFYQCRCVAEPVIPGFDG